MLARLPLAVFLLVLVLGAPVAAATDDAPPLPDGSSASNMTVVGSLPLPGGVQGDIWVHHDTAYVGTWREPNCPATGVKIVDVSDPSSPQLLGTLAQHDGTSQEDITVIGVNTPTFSGDLLAVGLQVCGEGGLAGVELWDVSDPHQPRQLAFLETPNTGGVHELSMIQRPGDGKVLALLAVPASEDIGAGADFRIVDATDPRKPQQVGQWSLRDHLGLKNPGGQGQDPRFYDHSAATNAAGTRAFLSWWDAGVVILDIQDPTQPQFIGKTSYQPQDEGNAHSVALAQNEQLMVAADEDYYTRVPGIRIDGPPELAGKVEAVEGLVNVPLALGGPVSGDLVYLGRACPDGQIPNGVPGGDPLLGDPKGKIAVIDRGDCLFALKLKQAEDAGAIGAIVVNNVEGNPIAMGGPLDIPSATIPAVMLRQEVGAQIKTALAGGTAVSATLASDIVYTYDSWGYLRFVDISDPANPRQVSTFGTANTFPDPELGPPDQGRYSAHNPIVDGNLVYVSWYSDGVRALDIADPANPVEVGHFVPPDSVPPDGSGPVKSEVWGVVQQGDLLYLSDMNYGLWIVRYTPG